MDEDLQNQRKSRLIICGFVVCVGFLSFGCVQGWAALRASLEDDGVFACPINSTTGVVPNRCPQRERKFNLAWTTASALHFYVALPSGFLLDKIGPRVVAVGSLLLCALGTATFALAPEGWYLCGLGLLGLAGQSAILCSYNLANLYDTTTGRALQHSCFIAAYGFSVCVLPVISMFYPKLVGITIPFAIWTVLLLLAAGCSCVLWPKANIKIGQRVLLKRWFKLTILGGVEDTPSATAGQVSTAVASSKALQYTQYNTFWSCLFSPMFAAVLCYHCGCLLRVVFTIGQIHRLLEDADPNRSQSENRTLITAFTWLYTLSNICLPIPALLIGKVGYGSALLAATFTFVTEYVLITFTSNFFLPCVSFFLLGVGRLIFFSTIIRFIMVEFGVTNFGRLLGVAQSAGATTLLLQVPLAEMIESAQSSRLANTLVIGMLVLGCAPLLCALAWRTWENSKVVDTPLQIAPEKITPEDLETTNH